MKISSIKLRGGFWFAVSLLFISIFLLLSKTLQAQSTVPAFIAQSDPPSGYIDPLEDQDTPSGTMVGRTDVLITFSKPLTAIGGGPLTAANFQTSFFRNGVSATDLATGQIPTLSLISGSGAGPYRVRFSPRLALGAWTQILVVNAIDEGSLPISSSGNRLVFGSLPMDVTQDGVVLGDDITRWIQINSNAYDPFPLTKLLLCDQTRNNTILGEDVTRAIQLINGYATHRIWAGYTIGNPGSAPVELDPSALVSQGLVGLWHMNGTPQDSIASRHGTLLGDGNCSVPGRFNQGCGFDGIGDAINIPTVNAGTSFTLSFWLLPQASSQDNWHNIISDRFSAPWMSTLLGALYLHQNQIEYWHSSDVAPRLTGAPIPLNQWALITLVVRPNSATLYQNGQSQGSWSGSPLLNNPLFIAAHDSGTTDVDFAGRLDDLAIWNRALSTSEVLQLSGISSSSSSSSSSSVSSSSSSSSSSSASTIGCSNGVQDGIEQGVDCGGNCSYKCPVSKILGIDINLNGTPGEDYFVEDTYHDARVLDEKLIYIKDNVQISFRHNQYNRKQTDLEGVHQLIGVNGNNQIADPTQTVCLSNFPYNLSQCDAGMIRYKIDGDEQMRPYVRENMADGRDNSGRTPYYTTPFTFAASTYLPEGFPVVGRTGNNGGAYYNEIQYGGARPKYGYQGISARTNYGILDQYGDERHTITFWDDDSAWNIGFALGASDGGIIHFVLNPKTPAIRFDATTSQAQYYSTPEKTYFIPRIFPRTTYLTRDVRITLSNITNTAPIWYRVNNGTWQQYTTPLLSHNLFASSTSSTFQYVLQATNPSSGITGVVKSRSIVRDPSYPSAQEAHPNNMLWDSTTRLNQLRQPYVGFVDNTPINRSDIFNGFRFKTYEMGEAFRLAKTSFLSGSFGEGAKTAKEMLLDAPWMHETVALEIRGNVDNSTPNRFALFYYQGNANEVIEGILAYDLLVGQFKTSNGYANGITPIEDHLLRDRFAAIAKNTLQFISAHEQHFSNWDPQGGNGTQHYAMSAEMATAIVSIALPTYNSQYYGTSGYNGQAATHLWAPFPNYPETWWHAVTNETHPSLLRNNPDRSTASHLNIWMLAKDGILGTEHRDYFSTYYGTNMERIIPVFSNILNNVNAPFNLTDFDWKIGDYMLCKKYNRCLSGGAYIYDPANEYRSRWLINKNYGFARELWNYLGAPSTSQGLFAEFFFDPASMP